MYSSIIGLPKYSLKGANEPVVIRPIGDGKHNMPENALEVFLERFVKESGNLIAIIAKCATAPRA